MRFQVALGGLGLLFAPELAQAGPKSTLVSIARAEAPGTPLHDSLLYRMTISNASDQRPDLDIDIDHLALDGSGVKLTLRSAHETPGYAVCLKVRGWDGSPAATRSGCFRWFDATRHDIQLLSGTEADRITNLHIDMYDVVGFPADWNGEGDPPSALAHEYIALPLTNSHPIPPVASVRSDGLHDRRSADLGGSSHAGPPNTAHSPGGGAMVLGGVARTVRDVDQAVNDIDRTVKNVGKTFDDVDRTVNDADKVINDVDKAVRQIPDGASAGGAEEAEAITESADGAVVEASDTVGEAVGDLGDTLIEALADLLEVLL